MKIYTRQGDTGETSLFGGRKVRKCDPRLEAYGTLDELNAFLGVARAATLPAPLDAAVERLQHELFCLGSELAAPDAAGLPLLGEEVVARIEREIDEFESGLAPLKTFILPGGTPQAAALHAARCVCRRAERGVVALAAEAPVRPLTVQYLNRISDYLFVLARAANAADGTPDVPWAKPTP